MGRKIDPRLGRVIRTLREARLIRQNKLAEILGIDGNRMSLVERGLARLEREQQAVVAEVFGLTLPELDRYVEAGAHAISPPGKIPLINFARAGGTAMTNEWGVQTSDAPEYIDRGDVAWPEAFAVRVVGDSMTPKLENKDVAVCAPVDREDGAGPRITQGCIVHVRFSEDSRGRAGEAGLFVWHDDGNQGSGGMITLGKVNTAYPPIRVMREEIVQLARVVEYRRTMVD